MRYGAETWRIPEIPRDAKTVLGAGLHERAGFDPRRVHFERDDVRDDAVGVDADAADLGETLRERFRVAVVVRQSVAHLLEPDERGSRDDAGLSHRAAEELSHAPRLRDRVRAAAEDRTDGRGESLRETELHRVDRGAEIARI